MLRCEKFNVSLSVSSVVLQTLQESDVGGVVGIIRFSKAKQSRTTNPMVRYDMCFLRHCLHQDKHCWRCKIVRVFGVFFAFFTGLLQESDAGSVAFIRFLFLQSRTSDPMMGHNVYFHSPCIHQAKYIKRWKILKLFAFTHY